MRGFAGRVQTEACELGKVLKIHSAFHTTKGPAQAWVLTQVGTGGAVGRTQLANMAPTSLPLR